MTQEEHNEELRRAYEAGFMRRHYLGWDTFKKEGFVGKLKDNDVELSTLINTQFANWYFEKTKYSSDFKEWLKLKEEYIKELNKNLINNNASG
jgi:hypothetical protein